MKRAALQFCRGILLAILLTSAYHARAFYDPTIGRWISRDPIAEKGGVNLCGFVGNNPVSRFDKLGNITVMPMGAIETLPCGEFHMDWAIMLDSPATSDGYIVQKLTLNYRAETCDHRPLQDTITYWEAFPVKQGESQSSSSGGGVDFWHYPASPGTRGNLTMSGELRFYLTRDTGTGPSGNAPGPTGWQINATYVGASGGSLFGPPWPMNSGSFPSTGSEPFFWGTQPVEQGGNRSVSGRWSCCCPENYSTFSVQ